MAEMEIKAQQTTMINEYGNWHVMMKDITNEQAKLISARPRNCLCRMDFLLAEVIL